MKYFPIVMVMLWAIFGTAWCVNLYRFAKCDFDAPWKGEIIHGIGIVVAPAAIVTVWFDSK